MTESYFKSLSTTEPIISETIDNSTIISDTKNNPDHCFGDIYDLANSFLTIESMTHKKLQKLCYYAKAWYLALNDTNLVSEPFEAWVHGAVQPQLYQKYRSYGFQPIPMYTDSLNDLPEEFLSFAREIFNSYGDLTGEDLEKLNHSEMPWQKAREGMMPWQNSDRKISEEDMKTYYRELMGNGEDSKA